MEHTTGQTSGSQTASTPEPALPAEIKFSDLGMSAKVQAAVDAAGYTNPTPIQAAAIPVALTGQDVLGIAQTGTGKTASFVLPMICRLESGRARARMPRSLILAPTRELAAQVAQSFEKYGVNHKLDVALLIGGVSMDDQVKKLDRGVDVLIATPGRLLDHFQRGRLMLMGVEILVIDEADRMLDMGFIPDIEKICKLLPPRRQTLFFSATMPPEITRLVDQFLKNPTRIEATRPATTATTITQSFMFCPDSEDWAKRDMLRGLLREDGVRNAIIFCNRKVDVAILLKSMLKHGFNAGALHGDMDQKSRMETLDKFRSGDIKFLVASDVAARGLDIPDVSHVFNFDLPRDSDDYVHRIGRTGRAGREGVAKAIVTHEDLKQLKDIEKMLGVPVLWVGEGPTEEDYASAGKRRRGGRSAGAVRADSRPSRGPQRGAGGRGQPRSEPRGEARGPAHESGQAAPEQKRTAASLAERPERRPRHAMRSDEGDGIPARHAEAPPSAAPATAQEPQQRQDRGRDGNRPRDDSRQRHQEPRSQDQASQQPARRTRNPGDVPGSGPQPSIDREPRPERQQGSGQGGEQRRQQQPARQPQAPRPERTERTSPAPQAERSQQSARAPQSTGTTKTSAAFAGDVPAFMRRSSRPVKAASD